MSWRPAFCHMRTRSVFSGERKYMLDLPVVPGCGANGRVRAVGPDATRLAVGDWVSCDPTVRARDDGLTPDITLQGWSARCEGGLRLQRYFRHGSFAEQIRVPTENAVPIGPIELADAGRWCAMTLCLVPYGGLLAANLRAGETVLISGATGNFGSAGVAVALAWGRAASSRRAATRRCWRILKRRFGRSRSYREAHGRRGAGWRADEAITGLMASLRKIADEELQQTRADLARFARVATVGELTASNAHEVNQPLAGVVSSGHACLRWLASEPPNVEKAVLSANRMIRDANRASEVIQRVRKLVKNAPPQMSLLDVNKAIEEIAILCRNEIEQNRISLKNSTPG